MRRDNLNDIVRSVLLEEGFVDSLKAVAQKASTAVSKTFTDVRKAVVGETEQEKLNSLASRIISKFNETYDERLSTSTDLANRAVSRSFDKNGILSFVVVDSAGSIKFTHQVAGDRAIPDFAALSKTCAELTKKTRKLLAQETLVFTDPDKWSRNFWLSSPRLADLRERLPEEERLRIGREAARHLQSSILTIPFVWVIANNFETSAEERIKAWTDFSSTGENTLAYYVPNDNCVFMNLTTDGALNFARIGSPNELTSDYDVNRSVLIHEIMHSKSTFMTRLIDIIVNSIDARYFRSQGSSAKSAGTQSGGSFSGATPGGAARRTQDRPPPGAAGSDFVSNYQAAVRGGWAASIVGSDAPNMKDFSALCSLMAYAVDYAERDLSDAEIAANIDALVSIVQNALNKRDKPTLSMPNLAGLSDKNVLMRSSELYYPTKGAISGFPAYNFGFDLGTGKPVIDGVLSNYTVKGVDLYIPLDQNQYVNERSSDLSSDEHVYNALTHLQRLFVLMKQKGVQFDSGGVPIPRRPAALSAGKITAGDIMAALVGGKHMVLNSEDTRRIAVILAAAVKNKEGELPKDFFYAVDTLAVRDTSQRGSARVRGLTRDPMRDDQAGELDASDRQG
jgi:hypothetical protein